MNGQDKSNDIKLITLDSSSSSLLFLQKNPKSDILVHNQLDNCFLMCSNLSYLTTTPQQRVSSSPNSLPPWTPSLHLWKLKATAKYSTAPETWQSMLTECMKDLHKTDLDLCFAQIKAKSLVAYPFNVVVAESSPMDASSGIILVSINKNLKFWVFGYIFFVLLIRYDEYNFFSKTLSSQDYTICSKREKNVEDDLSDYGPVCFSIWVWMGHLDEDENFICLYTKSVTHSDGSSGWLLKI